MAVSGSISRWDFAAGGRAGHHFAHEMVGTAADLQILLPVWKSQQRSGPHTRVHALTHMQNPNLTDMHFLTRATAKPPRMWLQF